MIDTSYDSERQAGLSSANLVRVGLSSLDHSFRLSAQHLTCLPRFLPPFRVPCSTVLARLLWREMWPNHASFLLSLSLTGFLVLLMPLYLFVQIRSSYGPSMRSLTFVCNILFSNACILLVESAVNVQLLQPQSRVDRTGVIHDRQKQTKKIQYNQTVKIGPTLFNLLPFEIFCKIPKRTHVNRNSY